MERLLGQITARPLLVLALTAAVSALALSRIWDLGTGARRLEIDISVNRLLPESDEGKLFYDRMRRAFGSDETIVVALHSEDTFSRESLQRVKRLTGRLEEVPGVHHVLSLANAPSLRGDELGLDVRPFFDAVPDDPAELERVRREALANPLYAGNLVSRDGRTTALLVYFHDFSDREFLNRGIDDEIVRIAHDEAARGRSADVWITGAPHVKVAQLRAQMDDLRRSMVLIAAALAVVLAFTFRTVRGVILPLLTIAVSLVATLGLAASLGRPLNIITVLVPPLLLILGLSYTNHVVADYYRILHEEPELPNRAAVRRALAEVWIPVAICGLTTAAGFVSLVMSPMGAVREFGVLSLVGVMATMLFSLTFTPAALAILPRPSRRRARLGDAGGHGAFDRLARSIGEFDLRHRRALLWAAAGIVLVSALAATQVRVGANSMETFPRTAPVRRDFEAINAHLEGASTLNVVVHSERREAFKEPETLKALASLEDWLQAQPEIGGTTSVVDYVKLLNRGLHENDPEHFQIPDSPRLLAQLLMFGGGDELEAFVDARYELANVRARTNVIDTELVEDLARRIDARTSQLPAHLHATVTGNPILVNRVAADIVRGQATSLFWALALIYGILCVMFLSARTGAIALIPNVVPIAVYFGALGVTGITLNPATSLIAPMALGIAVDDTIHYFERFTRDAKRLADERAATVLALREVGRPVTYTAVSICIGFLVLTGSELRNQVQLGGLGAFVLAFGWFVEMFLTPALCSGLRVITLWDTLSLDLGAEPQVSIPVFRGLSKAQTRIVALMTSLRRIPAGQRLIRTGERGREMYVVIEGKLEIFVERAGRRILLNTCGRGDVVGEVGFFYQTRSADVAVVEDARLLRFTQKNMERLRRRYPRIAAQLFRNLSEVLATRLSSTTEKLR